MTEPADAAALAARLSIEPHHLALVRQILARLLPASKAAKGSKPAATAKPDALPPRKTPRKKASA